MKVSSLFAGLLAAALTLALPVQAQTAPPTVTISAAPAVASGSATPTITWSTSPAGSTGCTASGAWTGTKAASGSQLQPVITANATYSLTCSWPGAVQTFTFTLDPPTTNTDGSPLTNLAGFRIFYGTNPSVLNLTKQYDGSSVVLPLQPAVAGTYTAVSRAFTTTGAESDNSNTKVFTVAATPITASNSATVVVNSKPNPPTNFTGTIAVASGITIMSMNDGFERTVAFTVVNGSPGEFAGLVKVATPALDGSLAFDLHGQHYCRFLLKHPRTGVSNIAWDKGVTPTQDVAAPCG